MHRFGRLDILVNNAGILRDWMLVNMEEDERDAVVTVHLKGHFAPLRHAAAYWRGQAKAGTAVAGRVINTSSPSGVFGNGGQSNYGTRFPDGFAPRDLGTAMAEASASAYEAKS